MTKGSVEERLKELLNEKFEDVGEGEDWIEVRFPNDKSFRCKKIMFSAGEVEGSESIWVGGVAGRLAVSDLMAGSKVIEKSVKEVLDVMIKENPMEILKQLVEAEGSGEKRKKDLESLEALLSLLKKMG